METLADQLRRAVNECEWSLNSIAREAGIPQPVLYRFVNGQRDAIRLDTADKLCRLFGMRLTKPQKLRD